MFFCAPRALFNDYGPVSTWNLGTNKGKNRRAQGVILRPV